MANKGRKKRNIEGTRLSLLNCTWREIPLNSSWQRQWAGRKIKRSLSRSPINTSHSLASLPTPLHLGAYARATALALQSPAALTPGFFFFPVLSANIFLRVVCFSSGLSLSGSAEAGFVRWGPRVPPLRLRELWLSSRTPPTSHRAPDDWSRCWRRPGPDLHTTRRKKKKKKEREGSVTHICFFNNVACLDLI